jgi:hypothetical protein
VDHDEVQQWQFRNTALIEVGLDRGATAGQSEGAAMRPKRHRGPTTVRGQRRDVRGGLSFCAAKASEIGRRRARQSPQLSICETCDDGTILVNLAHEKHGKHGRARVAHAGRSTSVLLHVCALHLSLHKPWPVLKALQSPQTQHCPWPPAIWRERVSSV